MVEPDLSQYLYLLDCPEAFQLFVYSCCYTKHQSEMPVNAER